MSKIPDVLEKTLQQLNANLEKGFSSDEATRRLEHYSTNTLIEEAVVTATGMNTYFGKTAGLVQKATTTSHFQRAVLKN
jgi:magnesium-transporting ATPase (P-type)